MDREVKINNQNKSEKDEKFAQRALIAVQLNTNNERDKSRKYQKLLLAPHSSSSSNSNSNNSSSVGGGSNRTYSTAAPSVASNAAIKEFEEDI